MLRVDPLTCVPEDLAAAAEWVNAGGVVAYPTDTLYGLAVDPMSETAVKALFMLKGRDVSAALPLIAASRAQVEDWVGPLGSTASRLVSVFWPGPLSLICDAPRRVVPAVHGGRGTIAIRVPDHAVARALASAVGRPVTATSANRSGEPPAQRADELRGLDDPRLLVVDGGATAGGPPSTIVDARRAVPVLVREGAIAWKRVLESLQG
jgi:L-threonylcarbamoyladenylate synthase